MPRPYANVGREANKDDPRQSSDIMGRAVLWQVGRRCCDRFGPEFYAHRLPHRNGAKQEQTGNVPRATTYTLVLLGALADDAKQVLGAFLAIRAMTLCITQDARWSPIDAQWDLVNGGSVIIRSARRLKRTR